MDVEFRPIVASETEAFIRVDAAAFGVDPRPETVEYAQDFLELDRTVAAVEDGRIVGTSGALSWELTAPGPALVPAAAGTGGSGPPTPRRRGRPTPPDGRPPPR